MRFAPPSPNVSFSEGQGLFPAPAFRGVNLHSMRAPGARLSVPYLTAPHLSLLSWRHGTPQPQGTGGKPWVRKDTFGEATSRSGVNCETVRSPRMGVYWPCPQRPARYPRIAPILELSNAGSAALCAEDQLVECALGDDPSASPALPPETYGGNARLSPGQRTHVLSSTFAHVEAEAAAGVSCVEPRCPFDIDGAQVVS